MDAEYLEYGAGLSNPFRHYVFPMYGKCIYQASWRDYQVLGLNYNFADTDWVLDIECIVRINCCVICRGGVSFCAPYQRLSGITLFYAARCPSIP